MQGYAAEEESSSDEDLDICGDLEAYGLAGSMSTQAESLLASGCLAPDHPAQPAVSEPEMISPQPLSGPASARQWSDM